MFKLPHNFSEKINTNFFKNPITLVSRAGANS